MRVSRRAIGGAGLAVLAATAVMASFIAPRAPGVQVRDHAYAPPMLPRVVDEQGRWQRPFVYPLRLVDRLERRYVEDRTRKMPLRWFEDGALVTVDARDGAWLLLGGDALGRDVYARLARGARWSLGVAVTAALIALAIGVAIGGVAGYAGGAADRALMRLTDLVVVLPAIYIVLTLRAVMPLVLSPAQTFWTMAGVLAVAGWPYPARAVRAVIAAERHREYAEAARASGAGPLRILLRHLLPSTRGVVAVQATLLLPAFILAEATLSFVGFGFLEPTPSWGLMLQDAGRVAVLAEAPWLLAPAAAIVASVLSLQLAGGADSDPPKW